MVDASGIPLLPINLPKSVDMYVRSGKGSNGEDKTVWILVNFDKDVATVTLPNPMMDVLETRRVESVKLERYGVAVLSRE
jgi:hypothetical protein